LQGLHFLWRDVRAAAHPRAPTFMADRLACPTVRHHFHNIYNDLTVIFLSSDSLPTGKAASVMPLATV